MEMQADLKRKLPFQARKSERIPLRAMNQTIATRNAVRETRMRIVSASSAL